MRNPDITVELKMDDKDFNARIAHAIEQVKELRSLTLRPWWCPRWIFRMLND